MPTQFPFLCLIQGFDHLEFYVGNAQQAAHYYSQMFGFTLTAYCGLESGDRKAASYVLEQGHIRFVLSTGLSPEHPISRSVQKHGDAIAVIALTVEEVPQAYRIATERGAVGAIPPTTVEDAHGVFRYAAIRLYGDVLLKFIERRQYFGPFAPGFVPHVVKPLQSMGLMTIDHVVGNVEVGEMDHWVEFLAQTLGFQLLAHFDETTISTQYSALQSKVMQDSQGLIKLPINEPAAGQRKSQIQEYLDYHQGPGIQHVALSTSGIIESVTRLKSAGVKFLTVPSSYYETLDQRVGPIDEPIEKLADLGILADRNAEGYLLQIFTQPVQDRPTLFFEVIERHGSQGFGEGNFKALFEAIEREQAKRGNL
ncbi:4-hydroxyphenylpyruvate dioxygenase [Lyngbya confervoides]|uniref:4-hydroxyphenylpyruvate dioxygenase n=1 Tax=Lyngbya confervoides BDU141951 TaxID=1574623 RepID=A0ABD4SZ72_9CYAN|nr:4-hydroxyphenylpyruvate dioxygenase [Lyngbya confervoides]MCM1981721.1 4-hydroxyphenylpyruvate dioxygenase [Lyngbya confervoides BDU141951]